MHSHPDSTSMATETLVSKAAGSAGGSTGPPAGQAGSTQPTEGSHPTPRPSNFSVGSLAAVRRSLRSKGLSKTAAKLIANAVRVSTRGVYKGRFQEFVRWCDSRGADPFQAPILVVANFLGRMFKKGLSYSTLCGYRSAISSYHDLVDGVKVGQHPTLIRLLKGVFNLRPPMRSLAPTWDLPSVLKALRLPPFEHMLSTSLKWVTLKTTFLVAICTAGRSSDITKLGFTRPHFREEHNPDGIRFVPLRLRKQDRPGHLLKDIFVPAFREDRKLDPVRAIKLYLRRVRARRGGLQSLFVTYGAGEVSRPSAQTVAHWITDTINACLVAPGVKVRAHSTRSASTSMALQRGVGVANILRAADWASECTFANHYLKDSRSQEGAFGAEVLRSANK